MLQCTKIREQAVAGGIPSIVGSENANLQTWKRPGTGPGLKGSAQRAPALGRAGAINVRAALSLDGPSGLIGHPRRQLRNALVGVNLLLQAVPRQIALTRHKVLDRTGTRQP